jgi:hypothetical protein
VSNNVSGIGIRGPGGSPRASRQSVLLPGVGTYVRGSDKVHSGARGKGGQPPRGTSTGPEPSIHAKSLVIRFGGSGAGPFCPLTVRESLWAILPSYCSHVDYREDL